MRKIATAAGSLALVAIVSCGRIPTNHPASVQAIAPVVSAADQVVADSRQGGNQTLQVHLIAPQEAAYRSQSIVHRPTASDVVEYLVSLQNEGQTLLTITVNVKSGQTVAVFDGLKLNQQYEVSVEAMGNDGGDPSQPLVQLNTQNPAVGSILFSGEQDVENTQSITVQVTLDSIVFSGSASVDLSATDGSYENPDQPESGTAWPTPAPSSAPSPVPTETPAPSPSASASAQPAPSAVPSQSPTPAPSASAPAPTGATLTASPTTMGATLTWSGLDLTTLIQTSNGPEQPNQAEVVLSDGQSEFLGPATSGFVNMDGLPTGTTTAQIMAVWQGISLTGQSETDDGPVQASVSFDVL